jgi:hypothetical protein
VVLFVFSSVFSAAFQYESILEHKVGLLKWDSLFKEGEGDNLPNKSMFHCVEDGVNPYFE